MKYIIYLLTFVVLSGLTYSQGVNGKDVQILLKGKVTDEFTGNPVSVTMEFREENNGKKFKIQSNSADGYYQQVLVAGRKYDVVFINNDIVRKIVPIAIENSSKYTEQTIDFSIKKLTTGLKYFKLNAFEAGSAQLSAEAKANIESLQDVMKFNRGVYFEFVVTSHDTYRKEIVKTSLKKPEKKKSKKKALPPPEMKPVFIAPDPSLAKELSGKRLEAVKAFLSGWTRYSIRLSTIADESVAEADGESFSLYVIVKEIKSVFE